MQSTAKDAISLETLLKTKREDLPRGIRYVTGGAVFRQHQTSSDVDNNIKPELLVIKRSKNDVFPGHWEVPGGSMESGETVLQGLTREVFEETGLDVENVVTRLEDNVFESGNPPRKWIQFHFIVTVKSTSEVKLDPNEHEEWRWVTEESVRGLQRLPGQISAMREAFTFVKGNGVALKL